MFFFNVASHLGSIDEVENLLHEIVEKDCLAEAEAKVPVGVRFVEKIDL